MSLTADTARRLAFIRLLVARAVEDAGHPAPFSYDSINRLHDAAETFLALAAQQQHVAIPKDFLGYWDALEPALGRPLSYKAQMQKLNKVRVGLKHYGAEPAPAEISAAVSAVTGLLEDECQTIFGVALDEISLASLVDCQGARDLLVQAEQRWASADATEAFGDLADAFDVLIRDYERRKMIGFGTSVFDSASDMTFVSSFHQGLSGREERQFVDRVIESLKALDFAVMLVGLGVDFRRYGKFKALTPVIMRFLGGGRRVSERRYVPERGQAEFEFCRDFVVETAVHLAAFDYDLADPLAAMRASSSETGLSGDEAASPPPTNGRS